MKKIIEGNVWQWKTLEYFSYLVLFLTPLILGKNHYYIFSSPKIIILSILIPLMLIIFVWGYWNKEFKIRFNLVSYTLLFFILILTLSSVFGVDPINSFFSWAQSSVPLITVYILSIFSLLVAFLCRKEKRIIMNLLLISFISSILTLILFYIGVNKSFEGSTLGNSSYLGEYLFFNILFGVSLLFIIKGIWEKILITLGVLFLLYSPIFINIEFLLGRINISKVIESPLLLLGVANAATLGLIISTFTLCLLLLALSSKKYLKIIGLILVLTSITSFYYFGERLTNSESSLHKIYVQTKTGNRLLSWDIAKQGFSKAPLLGNGFNNYIYTFEKEFTTDFYNKGNIPEKFYQPHNIFWEYSSNTGAVGVFSFLLLLGVIVYSFIPRFNNNKSKEKYAYLILASIIVGYFIQNLFAFDTITTYLLLFLVVGIAVGHNNYLEKEVILRKKITKIIIILVSLLCITYIYLFAIKPYMESKGLSNKLNKNEIQNISLMGGIIDTTLIANDIYKVYRENLSKINNNNKDRFLRDINNIILQIDEDVKKQPNHADAYLIAGKLMNLYMLANMKDGNFISFNGNNYNKSNWEKTFVYLSKSKELNPNNVQLYLTFSQLYLIKRDIESAKIYSKKSIIIAPENKEVYNFARSIIKIYPDKIFENFINQMEHKWIIN